MITVCLPACCPVWRWSCCLTPCSPALPRHLAPQVEGKGGFNKLVQKVRVGGPTVLYHGALAASAATFVGHYPWCVGVWGCGGWGWMLAAASRWVCPAQQ